MRHKKFTERADCLLTPEWKARLEAVANHPRILDTNSSVVRDCITTALPQFEAQLGIIPDGEDDDVVDLRAELGLKGGERLDTEDAKRLVPTPGTGWGPDRG